ncbi:hypothetical protein MUCCIDRAFT_77504 [Mucor lusitanicus CBS 277.49]|uniref:Uncharacterized protein n=1 Tax=Mucor lusitanicus CBS 277.49 TaxID=747725 RepID=A0A168PCR7_MUCCL|nr:hypothetical protein MUCCIDRAFT_77504 [Mucor lusitanicus CBS 277.49]
MDNRKVFEGEEKMPLEEDQAVDLKHYIQGYTNNLQYWSDRSNQRFTTSSVTIKLLKDFNTISSYLWHFLELKHGSILVQGTYWFLKTPARLDFGGSRMAVLRFKAFTGSIQDLCSAGFWWLYVQMEQDGFLVVQGTYWDCKTSARLDSGGSRSFNTIGILHNNEVSDTMESYEMQ